MLLPAWLLWLCVFLFSSLFIQCMWMLNKPLWISSIYSLLEHCHHLSGQTAWLHHFQSGIVSICCFPGSIAIVFLFGWLVTDSCRQRQSYLQPQELFGSVPKARWYWCTELFKIAQLASSAVALNRRWYRDLTSRASLMESIVLYLDKAVRCFPDSGSQAVCLQGDGYCMLLCYPEIW